MPPPAVDTAESSLPHTTNAIDAPSDPETSDQAWERFAKVYGPYYADALDTPDNREAWHGGWFDRELRTWMQGGPSSSSSSPETYSPNSPAATPEGSPDRTATARDEAASTRHTFDMVDAQWAKVASLVRRPLHRDRPTGSPAPAYSPNSPAATPEGSPARTAVARELL